MRDKLHRSIQALIILEFNIGWVWDPQKPEQEYQIPENPILGIFGIPNFQKCSIPELQDSGSKKIQEWPLPRLLTTKPLEDRN